MLQRPDPQSFTKFLASVGLFLCIVALVGQGLVLRETRVLEIRESELRAYTPLARQELQRRQGVARDVALAAPWVGGCMLALGVVMLACAVPRLRRQELTEDEKHEAELMKLKREIEPQSQDERWARIKAEAAEAIEDTGAEERAEPERGSPPEDPGRAREQGEDRVAPEPRATTEPSGQHTASHGPSPSLESRLHEQAALMRQVADIEERVLQQVAHVASPLYELRPQVKIGKGDSPHMMDGLLVSEIDQLPDVVVEIKFVRSGASVGKRIHEASQQLRFPLASLNLANPKLWLIVVTETALAPEQLDRLASVFASSEAVVLSVIEESRIHELTLPRDRFL